MKSKINFQKMETDGASYHGVCYVFSKKVNGTYNEQRFRANGHLIQIELKKVSNLALEKELN